MLGKWNREVPVYLFTGFLEGGKTSFINESMSQEAFTEGERNLVIVYEQGEIECDFPVNDSTQIEIFDEFNRNNLLKLNDSFRPEKVLIEYNGMWNLEELYRGLPENWIICQEMAFFDSRTFLMLNTNMRNLVFDKMKFADLIVFNRFEYDDVTEFHRIVRVANRNAQIVYETPEGTVKVDEIVDPLPFNINEEYIIIKKRDYAWWYRDADEMPENYKGKKITFEGMIKSRNVRGEDRFIIGRPLMTCCEEDIEFTGIRCVLTGEGEIRHNRWAKVTGVMTTGRQKKGEKTVPVMKVMCIECGEVPEDAVATFW